MTAQSLTYTLNGTPLNLDLAADGVTLVLNPPSDAISQQWVVQQDSGSGITYIQSETGWLAIDFSKMGVYTPWLDQGSNNSCIVNAATEYTPMQIVGVHQGQQMMPTADGKSVEMVAFDTTGWAWTTPVPPPAGPSPSPYVPAGYVYTWGDEFTAANLDTTKWWTRYAGDGGLQQNISSNGELELFSESNNHVMTGSSVKLTAYPPVAPSTNYLSGMLRGKQTFNFGSPTTAFYIEVKMKIPNAQGAWPAFWFSAEPTASRNPPPWPPEADVAEFMINIANGDTSSMIGVNVQLNGQNPPNPWNSDNWSYGSDTPSGWTWSAAGRTKWETPIDYSQDFHIFAIHVVPGVAGSQSVNPITGQPTHMLYYYADGYNTFNSQYDFQIGADGTEPYNAELLLDLAVGGFGGGTPDPTKFPCAFEIEYVRVYLSQADSSALVPSTIGQDLMPSSGG